MNPKPRDADPVGPWDAVALAILDDWDADWARACRAMSTNPWKGDVLPLAFAELVSVAVSVACTNLDRAATRRHIRAALDAGASREQILTIIQMASVMAIHSCSLGAPILLEEAAAAGAAPPPASAAPTPACDRMKAMGQWNAAWDPFFALDPVWTDQFMATAAAIYGGGVFTPKEIELLSIAFDASFTHMYAPGARRHIRNALATGASVAEVMEVLKLCVAQGIAASNLGVPILAEELMRREEIAR
ncbi:MAG: gamma-carboxymuconolactone decarboxylase [Rhodovulum sulfidophilum]|uniref:Gamma-carboxymuconolactone decarboxylase n=1 Tax=Rhodovulum sulfidophilum TaxID=35806 RepID=A0A2W5Q4I5_RHOSU|nr:MAG: gamma-carboxymuconolactone decarboxylase [Rhodovulum sulfidophilum]